MVSHTAKEQGSASENHERDGWYLLRRGTAILGRSYRAGSVVERLKGAWHIHEEVLGPTEALPLHSSMVCEVSYDGVALFVVECDSERVLHARPVSGSLPLIRIDPMLINSNMQPGDTHVCARFGRCFLPLEFFGW